MNSTDTLKRTLYFSWMMLMLPTALLISAAMTGRIERQYEVLSPESRVAVGPTRSSLQDLAATYRPNMLLNESTPSPELLWIWFEAVDASDHIDLVYYFVWENELHPEKTLNKIYSLFRAAYFGYPLYDIEFFQISVDKANGSVKQVLFETACEKGFFQEIPLHCSARFLRESDSKFTQEIRFRDGRLLKQGKISPAFNGSRITAAVQTWNHLSILLKPPEIQRASWRELDAPLKILSAEDYASSKFARKSQGDHKTSDRKSTLAISTLVIWLMLTLGPLKVRARLARRPVISSP